VHTADSVVDDANTGKGSQILETTHDLATDGVVPEKEIADPSDQHPGLHLRLGPLHARCPP
jgi:hypothetical protein